MTTPENKISEKVKNKTSEKVENKISEKVKNKTSEKVKNKTSEKVENKTSEKVENKTSEKVENKISEKVENKTSEKVDNKKKRLGKNKSNKIVDKEIVEDQDNDKNEDSQTNVMRDDEFNDIFAYADKREGVIWTEEEVRILKDAINKYGKGNWRKILDSIKDDLNPNRRLKDLSDKVRILDKMTTYRRRTRKYYWEVDQNNNPICKMGEKVVYHVKLPFEAAEKCAHTKNYTNGEGKIIKICYEEAGRLWYHIYVAKYSRDPTLRQRIRVRKVAGQSPYRNDGM